MQKPRWGSPRGSAVLRGLAAAALCVMLLPGPAAANDEDEAFDIRILRSILGGIGLKRDGEAGIDYRERSPLVVPPQITLPPPETSSAAERNPAWPADPDIRRQREVAAARGKARFDEVQDSRALQPHEMTPGRANRPPAQSPWAFQNPDDAARPMLPSALGYVGGLFGSLFGSNREETKVFTGEPPRTALTEPPPGYRTPSSKEPYGIGPERYEYKPMDPMDLPARSN